MVSYIEYLKIPAAVGGGIAAVFLMMQFIGGILDFKGKAVPAIMNIRKHYKVKKQKRQEADDTLKAVQALLKDVNNHYSADNIAKRDGWIQWVNARAKVYDESIDKLRETLNEVTQALKANTKMTEEIFIQSSRDRIIDFATKVGDESAMVSREEFNRIFKVHDKYEKFLEERELTNGEIDINFQIIKESYENHLRNHTFIEDKRGYN